MLTFYIKQFKHLFENDRFRIEYSKKSQRRKRSLTASIYCAFIFSSVFITLIQMGHDMSLVLRQDNLMTKIMLKQQQSIIEHLEQQKIELNRPINQMGDTLLHYSAYKSLKQLTTYLLDHEADPNIANTRGLSPIDVALPDIREWMLEKIEKMNKQKSQSKTPKAKKG